MELVDHLFINHRSVWLYLGASILIGCFFAWLTTAVIALVLNIRSSIVLTTIREKMQGVLYFFFPTILCFLVIDNYVEQQSNWEWVYFTLKVAIVTISAWLLIRIIEIVEHVILNRLNIDPTLSVESRKLYTRIKFIKRVVTVAVSIIAFAILLLSFEKGRQFGVGLLTSAGIVSVIIGFAAQKTLGNLLASMQIAFSQPIKIGDTVVMENEVGQIEEINLTYVVVRLWDKRRLILPINYIVEQPFQNWTRNDSNITGVVLLYLDYRTPMTELRNEFNRIVKSHPKWDGEICELHITDTQQQQIVVRATMSVSSPTDSFEIRSFVRENLIAWLRDNHPESLPGTRLISEKR